MEKREEKADQMIFKKLGAIGFQTAFIAVVLTAVYVAFHEKSWFQSIYEQTGVSLFLSSVQPTGQLLPIGVGSAVMILLSGILVYLGIFKKIEPLLLVPIGMGGILSNFPGTGLTQEGGFLFLLYEFGVQNGFFPLLIFLGLGAMIDFGPLIANPKTALLGGAAQFAIFGTFLGALFLGQYVSLFDVTLKQAASIAIVGGADGPTSIFLAARLAPELLGAVAIASYSYMALVPVIQPPLMRLLTTHKEKCIEMCQLRPVSKREKILFPVCVILMTGLFIPMALPLIGMMMFGNLLKECGVCDTLAKAAKDIIVPVTTVLLGLCMGSKLSAELFLVPQTLLVLGLGVFAFALGSASGILMAKFMNLFLKDKMNPLIGSAGVSAIPMAARVSEKLGLEANEGNHLLMHAMGANVGGSIGSALAAGILLALCG